MEKLKITSQAILAKLKEYNDKLNNKGPLTREISQTEVDWVLCDLDYTSQSFVTVRIPTTEAGERTTLVKYSGKRDVVRPDSTNQYAAIECRNQLSPDRQFTQDQIILIDDHRKGNFSLDKIHAHGMRPPELMCIDNPGTYSVSIEASAFRQLITRNTVSVGNSDNSDIEEQDNQQPIDIDEPFHPVEDLDDSPAPRRRRMNNGTVLYIRPNSSQRSVQHLPENPENSPWIDGAGRQIRFFSSELERIEKYLLGRINEEHPFPSACFAPKVCRG